jgi:hypothetical protein
MYEFLFFRMSFPENCHCLSAPQAPDPTTVANAQTKSNIGTATAQQGMNQINQVTPTGSLTYTQTGTNPDGTPKYTATTQLSQPQQQLLSTGQGAQQNLLDQIKTSSSTPFSLDKATEDQLDTLASDRLDPQLAKNQASLQQQLANQGIQPGTEAYNNAMTLNSQSANDQRNQLYLNGYTTAQNVAAQNANMPYQQLGSLSGNQAATTNTNLTNTPTVGVQPTDVTGITNQSYQDQLGQYQAQMSALGSLGSALGGWAGGSIKLPTMTLSDKRMKENVHDTGMQTKDGIPVKTYNYKGSPMMQMGVIAQEAQKKRPDAVKTMPSGFKGVDYGKLGSPMLAMGGRR